MYSVVLSNTGPVSCRTVIVLLIAMVLLQILIYVTFSDVSGKYSAYLVIFFILDFSGHYLSIRDRKETNDIWTRNGIGPTC